MSTDPADYGFITPSGTDMIRHGDDAITQNAEAAVGLYHRATTEGELRVKNATRWFEPLPNLVDLADTTTDKFLQQGSLVTLAGYTTSGMMPVRAGRPYTGRVRLWAWYATDGTWIEDVNSGTADDVNTQTAPAGAGFLRASWRSSYSSSIQIEEGAEQTPYTPFGVKIPYLIAPTPSDPITATVSPGGLQMSSALAGTPITISAGPQVQTATNGLFNIGSTYVGGQLVHVGAGPDEITPIRTEAGTVGGNHGCAMLPAWKTHDKTAADLGSVWTDGEREYTLIALTSRGYAHLAPEPMTGTGGEAEIPTALAGDLQHVSGAAHPSALPAAAASRAVDQVYPWVGRRRLAYFMDGARLTSGSASGSTLEVRESYEILDYRDVIAVSRAHPGSPFADHPVAGAVRVRVIYRYVAGLTCTVETQLTELTPTRLGECGFVQSAALSGSTVHRTVPGVTGWTTPVDLADHSATFSVTTADLTDDQIPPVMSLDDNGVVAFALGYRPWTEGATSSAERIGAGMVRFWDLRGTDKSYPIAITERAPGWGRIATSAYRAYLLPSDAAEVVEQSADAHAADAALESLTAI